MSELASTLLYPELHADVAARMLGLDRTQAVGLPLGGFVAGDSLQRLRAAIARLGVVPRRTACPLMLAPRHAPQRPVTAQLAPDPLSPGFQLVLADERDEAPRP